MNSAFDPFFPMGTYQSYWKAQNLDTLPDEALAVIAAKADSRPSPVTLAVVFHMGGAINRVGSADTAYGERTAQWMSSFDGNWENPDDNDANIAWVRDAFDQVARYGKGSTYTNFTGQADETADALARNAYGRQHGPTAGDQEAVRPRQLLPHQPEHPSGVAQIWPVNTEAIRRAGQRPDTSPCRSHEPRARASRRCPADPE